MAEDGPYIVSRRPPGGGRPVRSGQTTASFTSILPRVALE